MLRQVVAVDLTEGDPTEGDLTEGDPTNVGGFKSPPQE
jgi:hypothetical protein